MRYFLIFFLPLLLLAKEEVMIEVAGMHCPLCTTAVKKALSKVEGVEKVKVILETRKATVIAKESIEETIYLDAVLTTGYTGRILSRKSIHE